MNNPLPQNATSSLQPIRRLFHVVAGSTIPLIAISISPESATLLAIAASIILVLWETLRLSIPFLNSKFVDLIPGLFKPEENRRITGATYLSIVSVLVLILFPSNVAVIALLYTAISDPIAAIVGIRYGRHRMFRPLPIFSPSMSMKSWEGALAFLIASLAISTALWVSGFYGVFWPAVLGAFTATVIESLALPPDDNFTVPLGSGTIMAAFWVG